MKKFLSLLLAAVLSLGCVSAMALEFSVNTDELSVPQAGAVDLDIQFRESALAASTDIASVTTDMIIVWVGDAVIKMDLAGAGYGYRSFTQDMLASIDAYWQLADPYALQEVLVNNNVHLLLLDEMTNAEIQVVSGGTDGFASIVGTLADQTPAMQEMLVQKFCESAGIAYNGVTNFNGTPWLKLNDYSYLTIAGSQYFLACCPSSVDPMDLEYVLGYLTLTSN